MADYTRRYNRAQLIWQGGIPGYRTTAAMYEVFDLNADPEVVEMLGGSSQIGAFTPSNMLPAGSYSTLKFGHHIRGKHVADDPPPEGIFFEAAGFYRAQTGSTPNKVHSYTLRNPGFQTDAPAGDVLPIDFTYNRDNRQYILPNCVAVGFEAEFEARKLPIARWEFRGQVGAAKTLAISGYTETAQSVALTAGAQPVPVQSEGLTITSHGGTINAQRVLFKLNPIYHENPDINSSGGYGITRLAGWEPEWNVLVESNLLASFNPWTKRIDGTLQTVSFLHNTGGAVGTKLTPTFIGKIVDATAVDLKGIEYTDVKFKQAAGSALPAFAWT